MLLQSILLALGLAAFVSSDDWPAAKAPKDAGVDETKLASLLDRARAAKSDAVPDRSTKTQPCHSCTRTGFSPSVDLSNDSTSLKCGAPIRLPSCL